MARGESQNALELRWKRVGFVLFSVTGIAALTIGYSLQRRAHDALGIEIKAMEKETEYAKASGRVWRENLARQLRRESILRQVNEMRLDLTNIVPTQRRVIPLLARPSVAGVEPSELSSAMRPVPVGPLTGTATLHLRPAR